MARAHFDVAEDAPYHRAKLFVLLNRLVDRGFIQRPGPAKWKGAVLTTFGMTRAKVEAVMPIIDRRPPKKFPRRKPFKAIAEGRTAYPKSVITEVTNYPVLKPGYHNVKLGGIVHKGHLRGYHIYSLTLEERKTCPRSCERWEDCYGNNMGMADRFAYTPELLKRITVELDKLLAKDIPGVLVRLHVLGDFPSQPYVDFWRGLLDRHPRLSVYGYTAHDRDSPIGYHIALLNEAYTAKYGPTRFNIRFSTSTPRDPLRNATWYTDAVPDYAFACPEQKGQVDSCAECAACWEGTKTVAFELH